MEPESSLPRPGQERAPAEYRPNVESTPEVGSSETGIETGAERYEQHAEAATSAANAGMPSLTLPTPLQPQPTSVDDGSIAATAPITAGDDDLIEKEWVDRAKKIIADTREDPYGREKAVGELQKDYLKKRYGKELGTA